jgi:MFS family permease
MAVTPCRVACRHAAAALASCAKTGELGSSSYYKTKDGRGDAARRNAETIEMSFERDDAKATAAGVPTRNGSPLALLLNLGHALDHLFLLIFATAVSAIAADFGLARWEDLMPYTVGAFAMFGLGSIPAGRLGDLWGRRPMMIVFFFGMGAAALLVAATETAWQMAIALTVLGAVASIYHPVGIPMLVQKALRPGLTIGINGLAGNLGIAAAALLTGFLVKHFGWRMAFVVPGVVSVAAGVLFLALVPKETVPPARRPRLKPVLAQGVMVRIFIVMTATAITGNLIFNLTTNGNSELLRERFRGLVEDPATLGALLAAVYAVGSFAQLIVGRLIDKHPLKRLYLIVATMQIPLFALAAYSEGWALWVLAVGFMAFVFGAIPFIDSMIVRYVDDAMRSRVAGFRLAIGLGVSSLAVYLLGPLVKAAGFTTLLFAMAALAACTALFVTLLPAERKSAMAPAPAE